jgi:hypothetical protein
MEMQTVLRDFPALQGGRMVTVRGKADFYTP